MSWTFSERYNYFKAKQEQYPFLASAPIGNPRPEAAEGTQVVIPFKEADTPTALWMFDTALARSNFLALYPHAVPVSRALRKRAGQGIYIEPFGTPNVAEAP